MNSYFEQSGFYGGHGQTGADAHQAYRFPLGLGVNPYGPPSSGGVVGRGQVDSYDAAAAAAAAASCKLYEQQYKLDCTKDVVQSGYGSTGIVKSDNNSSAISSWAAAAAAAAAAERVNGNNGVGGGGGGVGRGGYPVSGGIVGSDSSVAVTPRAPPSSVTVNNNPWSPCSLNSSGVAVAPVPQQQQQQVQQQQHNSLVQQQQHTQVQQSQQQSGQPQQQQVQQQHHSSSGQHGSLSQQQSPQSQSSAHTFYPWMAIAGKPSTLFI